MLNLVWPFSRLREVPWGRLRPPSLPSPLHCPGRGTRDLEGLSTEVPLSSEAAPGDVENTPPAWPNSILSPDLCLTKPLTSPASRTTVHLLQFSFPPQKSATRAALTQLNIDPKTGSNFRERSNEWLIRMCVVVLAIDKSTHSLRQDLFAFTNRILCTALRHDDMFFFHFLFICFKCLIEGTCCQKCMILIGMCWQLLFQRVCVNHIQYFLYYWLLVIHWRSYRGVVWKDRVPCLRTTTTLRPTTLIWRWLGKSSCVTLFLWRRHLTVKLTLYCIF